MFGKLKGAGRWLGLGLVEGVTSNVHGSAVEWVPNLCHSQLVLKLSWALTIGLILCLLLRISTSAKTTCSAIHTVTQVVCAYFVN